MLLFSTEDHMHWPTGRPTCFPCSSSCCANARPGKGRQKACSALEIPSALFCHGPLVLPSARTGWDSGVAAPSTVFVTLFVLRCYFLPKHLKLAEYSNKTYPHFSLPHISHQQG